jgi:hypothetical protein
MTAIEKEDPACKRGTDYDAAYQAKNWANFFTAGKAVIAA